MSIINNFFKEAILHKKEVISGFKAVYLFVFLFLIATAVSSFFNLLKVSIYSLGVFMGNMAVVFFVLSLSPGIAKRFNAVNTAVVFLMSIRRQLGVCAFLLSFAHYASLRLFPILFGGSELRFPLPVFELLGVAALYALFPLWLTSNEYSVKKLGRFWRTIHSFVYFIVWLLFGHVALQGISISTILLLTFAVLEVASFLHLAKQKTSHINL